MRLTIIGRPIAKKRPRFVRRGKSVGTYNDQETEEGRWILEAQKQIEKPLENFPVKIDLTFWMPIPKSTSKKRRNQMVCQNVYHTKKPDLDNLIKWVLDCLNGIAWDDDSRVVEINAVKYYGKHPATALWIR